MQVLSDHSGSITRLAELQSIIGPRGLKWGLLSKDMSPDLAISPQTSPTLNPATLRPGPDHSTPMAHKSGKVLKSTRLKMPLRKCKDRCFSNSNSFMEMG